MIDVNCGWDLTTALAAVKRLPEVNPRWLEEPVHWYDDRRLLKLLAQNAGRVMSRDQLLEQLGTGFESFDRSIDVHVSRIRHAIEDEPRKPRRLLTVRGAGYVFARKQDQ